MSPCDCYLKMCNTFYLSGVTCNNSCEHQIKIAEPRHSSSKSNDKIYVLSIDQSLNATKCVWNFSTSNNFLLNLIFLNYTSPASAGSDCSIGYYLIKTYEPSINASSITGPYCGRRQNGIRVNGVISIELVAQREEYVAGLSLSVLIEASSKGMYLLVRNTLECWMSSVYAKLYTYYFAARNEYTFCFAFNVYYFCNDR